MGPIGFDMGHERLHMVQLEGEGDALRLRAATSQPFPAGRDELMESPKTLRAFVRDVLKQNEFVGRQVVSCMPVENLRLSLVNYRLRADMQEDDIVMRLATERLNGNPEQWVVDYMPVSTRDENEGERAALLALARHADIVTYLELLRAAGLRVEALDIGPAAIRRLIAWMHSGERYDTVLVVNFGRRKTYLTVISGRRLILDREVGFGEESVIEQIAQALQLDYESARELLYEYGVRGDIAATGTDQITADEISRTVTEIAKPSFLELAEEAGKALIYTASQTRGGSVDLVYLLGSVSRWPGSEALLNAMLSLPVKTMNPLAPFADDEGTHIQALNPAPGVAIAVGCALRGQGEHV